MEEYRLQSGICANPCFKSLSITESTVTLAVGGYNTGYAPGVTVTTIGELSPSGVDELTRLLAKATELPADTTFGCPSCADGAVSSLRLRVGNSRTTLSWGGNQAPTPLPELYEAFAGVISELDQCEALNRVQQINACVTTSPGFKIVRRPDQENDARLAGMCRPAGAIPSHVLLKLGAVLKDGSPVVPPTVLELTTKPDGSWVADIVVPPGAFQVRSASIVCRDGATETPGPYALTDYWLAGR